jgi:hypothetical protein
MIYVLYDNLLLDICELLIIFHAISEFTSIGITVYKKYSNRLEHTGTTRKFC